MKAKLKLPYGLSLAFRGVLVTQIFSFWFIVAPHSIAQEKVLFTDWHRGEEVFKAKKCQQCHAIRGQGGSVAQDLGWNEYYGSALDLAADLWNHSPVMREVMKDLEIERPIFSEEEMTALMAYLYYQRYVKETGNVVNGKKLLSSKGCLNCHSLRGTGGTTGPRLDKLPDYISPLFMAQAMWNHGPEMLEKMQEMNMEWPTFDREEIVDLTNYLRILRKDSYPTEVRFEPGSPEKGKSLLQSKGCLQCHSINGEGADVAPDFNDLSFDKSVTEIAGLMWNHGGEMMEMMKQKKSAWPQFEGREMTDLMSFFYYLDFIKQRGDPSRGQTVFDTKGCMTCHSQKEDAIGPDLTKLESLTSSIQMAQIMWNHAPNMETSMTELNLEWPQFTEGEMADLFAFLSNKPRQ